MVGKTGTESTNLASKSAEAARDTGDMIQDSMDKAELGSRIAGETAINLKEIVTGIDESSELVKRTTTKQGGKRQARNCQS